MGTKTFISQSPNETRQWAQALARKLKPGSIICLHGDLGSGKTTFVKGLASALGINEESVHSPTFVLMNIYDGKKKIYHFDLYRLKATTDILQLGYEEFLYGQGIAVIEWADKLKELYPSEYLQITLEHGGENTRKIHALGVGEKYKKILGSRERS